MGNNTFFNILAALGALAWLPFIIQLIREKLKKIKLKIISDDQIEIGYTTLGPILNINLAFLAQVKSGLIDEIKLELIHKSQEHLNFSWNWFEESLLQMDLPKLPIKYKKNQRAVALNVPSHTLVEKKIGFQNIAFRKESEEIIKLLTEDLLNLKSSSNKIEEIKSHSSYNKAIDYSVNSFSWRVGIYEAKFTIHVLDNAESFTHSLKFQLSNLDVKLLHKNIDKIKSAIENATIINSEEFNPQWEWVYVDKLSYTDEIKADFQNS